MSGGSMDYLCYKVKNEAQSLISSSIPRRKAFGKLLLLISEALHDIEWRDSGDSGEEEEIESIMKCINHEDVLQCYVEEAKKTMNQLKELIEKAENV